MIQEKQLKELFKYIEANWDVCVSQVDKTDIKRIFGGVLCEDIMNNTLHEVKAKPEELKGNCSTFDMSKLVDQEYKPTKQPSSQVKLDKPFDRERFEAMFRAVVASGEGNLWSSVFDITNQALKQLDAYYASKNN